MYIKNVLPEIKTINKPGSLVNINVSDILLNMGVDFQPTRSFYVNELNENKKRGLHSNGNVTEVLICISGSFTIKLNDRVNEVTLDLKQNDFIYIKNDIWIEYYNFNNCVILCLLEENESNIESYYDLDKYLSIYNE
jgi:mannose-6-phosphate isomerase-like protein (cupin superfamily)